MWGCIRFFPLFMSIDPSCAFSKITSFQIISNCQFILNIITVDALNAPDRWTCVTVVLPSQDLVGPQKANRNLRLLCQVGYLFDVIEDHAYSVFDIMTRPTLPLSVMQSATMAANVNTLCGHKGLRCTALPKAMLLLPDIVNLPWLSWGWNDLLSISCSCGASLGLGWCSQWHYYTNLQSDSTS